MTSVELPPDWARRPITDPDVFKAVIYLVSSPANRADGAVHLLLTHPDGRMLQPITFERIPTGAAALAAAPHWKVLLQELADHGARHLVIVLARPGPARRGPDDDALLTVLTEAVTGAGLQLLGRAIASPNGIVVLEPEGPRGLARPA